MLDWVVTGDITKGSRTVLGWQATTISVHFGQGICRQVQVIPCWPEDGRWVSGPVSKRPEPQGSSLIWKIFSIKYGAFQGQFCKGSSSDETQLLCLHLQNRAGIDYFFHSVSLCHLLALFLSSFDLGGAALIFVGFPHVPCNEAIACGNWIGVQIGIIALIASTVFLRTRLHQNTESDGQEYLGAIFFGVVMVMFNGYAELSMTIFRLPVFYKQRDLLFYPAWAYALPGLVLSIPASIAESGIYCIISYYIIGYAPEASRWITMITQVL